MPYIQQLDRNDPNAPEIALIQHYSSYVADFREITGYYKGYVDDRDVDQPTADNAWNIVEEDMEIAHNLNVMSLWGAGERFRVTGKFPELNYITTKAFSYIRRFIHSRKSLVYGSLLKGLAIQRKVWKRVTWREYPGMTWLVPFYMEEIPRGHIRVEIDPNDITNKYWTVWEPKIDLYVKMYSRAQRPNYKGPLIEDFIWNIWEEEPTFPLFRGLGQVLYRAAYIKNELIKMWATLCENYSHPFIVAMVDTMRSAIAADSLGTGFISETQRVQNLIDKIRSMVSNHVLALDKNADSFELKEITGGSLNIIKEYIEYLDKKIKQLLTGAELTTGTGEGQGSYAQSVMHRGITQTLINYVRSLMTEAIKFDLAYDFLSRNMHNITMLGYPFPEPDEMNLEFYIESEELKERILLEDGNEKSKRYKIAEGF